MANNVNYDPRYLSYDKAEVEELLGKVDNADSAPTADSENMIKSGAVKAALDNYSTTEQMNTKLEDYETKEALAETLEDYEKKEDMVIATEENVRNIVSDYIPDDDSSN